MEKSTVKKQEDWNILKLVMDFYRFLENCEQTIPVEHIREEYNRLFVDMIEVKSQNRKGGYNLYPPL